jgi:hypothetical protein
MTRDRMPGTNLNARRVQEVIMQQSDRHRLPLTDASILRRGHERLPHH